MKEKTALITGATDGIGKAVAKKLLIENWRVVIAGRNPQRCAATVAELKSFGAISAITADLTAIALNENDPQTLWDATNKLLAPYLNA